MPYSSGFVHCYDNLIWTGIHSWLSSSKNLLTIWVKKTHRHNNLFKYLFVYFKPLIKKFSIKSDCFIKIARFWAICHPTLSVSPQTKANIICKTFFGTKYIYDSLMFTAIHCILQSTELVLESFTAWGVKSEMPLGQTAQLGVVWTDTTYWA